MPANRRPRKPAKRVTPNQGRRATGPGAGKGGSFSRATSRKGSPAAGRSRAGAHSAGPRTGGRSRSRTGAPYNTQTKVNTSFMQEPPKFGIDAEGMHIPTGNSEMTITRRQLLIGAGVVAGVAAVGAGASAFQSAQKEAASFDTLTVAEDQVSTLDSFKETKVSGTALQASYELPFGTLVWCNSDSVAVCLLPTSKAKPLVKVALLALSTGMTNTVLSKAKGQSKGFQIYDARCSDRGLIWLEANILTGVWRIYTAPINSYYGIDNATKVDEGDASFDTPTLAAVGKNAFWQVVPAQPEDGTAVTGESQVKTAAFASPKNVQTIYSCTGRLFTDIAAAPKGVVVTPPHEGTKSYCQLTLLDAKGTVLDAMTLPASMTPQNVGYGKTGFTFTFPNIYDYGDGISQMGTYVPVAAPNGDYSNVNWFRFGRSPLESACWCGKLLMVKSSSAVCGINLSKKTYFTFSLKSGCQDYGDYLASEGVHDNVVTYQNIDNTEAKRSGAASSSSGTKCCLVRVWQVG